MSNTNFHKIQTDSDITCGGNLTVAGNISLTGDLSLDDATIADDLAIAGDLTVTGGVTAADLTATDDLVVGDDATITGDLAVTGTTALTGALTLTVPLTKANANASLKRFTMQFAFNNGGTLADGATYAGWILPGRICTVTRVSLIAQTPTGDGTNTVKVLKAASNGNTMLNAATFDPVTLVANTAQQLTLTATGADLGLTAAQGVYVEYVAGTQTVDAVNVVISVEFELTDV